MNLSISGVLMEYQWSISGVTVLMKARDLAKFEH